MKILDIGCGRGERIVNTLSKKGDCIGIDPVSQFIEEAEKNAPQNCQFFLSRLEDLDLGENEFDEVHCYEVLEHVDDLERSISQIVRLLKPQGRLFLSIPHQRSEKVLERLDKDYLSPEMHKRVFDPKELKEKLLSKGLKIKKYRLEGFFTALSLTYSFLRKIPYESQSGLPLKSDPILHLLHSLELIFDLKDLNFRRSLWMKRRKVYLFYSLVVIRIFLWPLRLITLFLNQLYPKKVYIEAVLSQSS